MLRTRDYALMLSAIVFLVVGIATTLLAGGGLGLLPGQSAAVFTSSGEPEGYDAVVVEKSEMSREERVASLRKKIASLGNLGAVAQETTTSESGEEESSVPEAPAGPIVENRCSNYSSAVVAWNSAGVLVEEVEGARLVYRQVKAPAVTASSSASSSLPTKQILATLPVRSLPLPSQTCIASNVIGITTNGSLIKNTDVAAYGTFGGETLIGYALDGFPIYGAAQKEIDICGGLVEGGQYRYQISPDRDTIITCFAGAPTSL